MTNYTIKINGANFSRWDMENGAYPAEKYKDICIEKIIESEKLTRKDVLKAVVEMLHHNGEVSEDDLFDGNEDFFTFTRLENWSGEMWVEGNKRCYIVSYNIDIKIIKVVKVSDIE